MKEVSEIRQDRRVQVGMASYDGMTGWLTMKGSTFMFVCSWGGGWDHVSVSLRNRCPSWNEMCEVKDIFFRKDECCVEYHPAEKDYVNNYPYCLNIWKPQKTEIPKPPKIFV